jgi:DNA-binding IclR family transcriptional regulator
VEQRFEQRNNQVFEDGPEEAPMQASGLASADLVLSLLERLAAAERPQALSDLARRMSISKARCHRHLRVLVSRGYVRQEADTQRYEAGVKLLSLGETVRERFDVLKVMRPQMARLREATGQAVTASALVEGQVTVLDMLPGRMVVEFGVRPGAKLDLAASAHGRIALAFGPPELLESARRRAKSPEAAAALLETVRTARAQGWATAPDMVLVGVNALAAPVLDHAGRWRGTLAIVGSSQLIAPRPEEGQLREVVKAAQGASLSLGWEG